MKDKLQNSMLQSIVHSNLSAVASLADVGLDALLDEDILRNIPIFGSIISFYKTGIGIRDRLYIKKVARFLRALSVADKKKRAELVAHLENKKFKIRFSENILMLIENADDIRKADVMGNLWAACADGNITYQDALRLCFMVNRAYYTDFEYLAKMKNGVQKEGASIAESLFSAGFLSDCGIDMGNSTDELSGGTIFKRNRFGKMLVRFGMH
jgi:hypothetical protein